MKTIRVAGNSYPSSQNCSDICKLLMSRGISVVAHTCIALFFWNDRLSSFLPKRTTMDPTPPNNASFDCRLSPFHVETKCDSRLLKVSLSIFTSSPILFDGSERAMEGRKSSEERWCCVSKGEEMSVESERWEARSALIGCIRYINEA